MNCGSGESLNDSTWCGLSAKARQIRLTADGGQRAFAAPDADSRVFVQAVGVQPRLGAGGDVDEALPVGIVYPAAAACTATVSVQATMPALDAPIRPTSAGTLAGVASRRPVPVHG
jgi:hypothetical protein